MKSSMNESKGVSAVARIKEMDALFEKLSEAFRDNRDCISKSEELRSAAEKLHEYLTCGDWLNDYELDEQGLLPPNCKRGVLSEDGLYNLLCDLRELKGVE